MNYGYINHKKVVRSDHLHRHMKNKHPEVAHPGPQSNRRRKKSEENISIDYTRSLDGLESGEPSFSGYSAQFPGLSYNNGSNSTDDEFDQEFLKNVKPQNSSSNNNAINDSDIDPNAVAIAQLLSQNPQTLSPQESFKNISFLEKYRNQQFSIDFSIQRILNVIRHFN